MAANRGGDGLSLRDYAGEIEAAAAIAKALAPTPFIPEALRRYTNPLERDPAKKVLDYDATVATVAAVLLAGQELELKPMASLRAITIIKGTVALSALTARAILLQRGHEIVVVETTAERAVVRARRAGSEHWQQSLWDLPRARVAGLYPGAERSNWKLQPKAMLVARATAEASRWVAADALLALPTMLEELEELDGQGPVLAIEAGPPADPPEPAAVTTKRTRKTVPAARAALPSAPPPAADPGPPVPEPPTVTPAGESADPAGPKPSKAMMDKLHLGLRDLGINDRAIGLAMVSGWAGRTVGSTTELSRAEMMAALNAIESLLSIAARQGQETAQASEEDPGPPPPDDAEPP